MLGHALAHLAHIVDTTRFDGFLDPRQVDRLDLIGDAGQCLNRIAVKILVADDDSPATGDPLLSPEDLLSVPVSEIFQDEWIINWFANHCVSGTFLLAHTTPLAIVVRTSLDPVIHRDEGVIRIANDGHQMRWDLVDDVADLGLVLAMLMKDRVVRKAPFTDEELKSLDVRIGRVLANDPLQIIDPTQQALDPLVPHLRGR